MRYLALTAVLLLIISSTTGVNSRMLSKSSSSGADEDETVEDESPIVGSWEKGSRRINSKFLPSDQFHVPISDFAEGNNNSNKDKRRSEDEGSTDNERRVTRETSGGGDEAVAGDSREGRAANNYHALFEHYNPKGQPYGLNLENFIETGGCNVLPPSWQKRVSGARVCGGCIRLYQGRDCTGRRSSDLASWNGCTFFQLYHFNDQASSVGACS